MSKKLEIYGLSQQTMAKVVRKLNKDVTSKRIGLEYLPFEDFPTEEITWDVVRSVSPIANFRAVDGEAELVGRAAFDRAYADVVSIAQKERFNASDLRKIREAGELPIVDGKISLASQMGKKAKRKVRNAIDRLNLAVNNRLEWTQINALLGKISFSGDVKFDVDYGIPAAQSGKVPSNLWSDTDNSTPLADLQAWQLEVQEESGALLDTVIMSRKALNYIKDSASLTTVMKYTNPLLSVEKAREVIEDNTGLKIRIYDATYSDKDGKTFTRFLAADTIIMLASKDSLPDGIGRTARVGHPLANYKPGHYTWQETVKDPYGLEVGIGIDAFPMIKHPEALLNAKVY